MNYRRIVPLIFALLLLAGCNAPDLRSDNVEVPSRSDESTESVNLPSVNDESTGNEYSSDLDTPKEIASDHGYPFLLAECSLDLNGDQVDDKAKLFQEWYPIFNEQGAPSFERGLLHYARVEFEINGNTYSHRWDEPSYGSNLSVMQNVDGINLCVVTLDVGGTGAGNLRVYPLTFDNGVSSLSMPMMDDRTGWNPIGFNATATYSDGYQMKIEVLETGYNESLTLPVDVDLSMYDENGVCKESGLRGTVYGISGANIITDGDESFLEITQYISGKNAASESVGHLTSRLFWKDGQYQVARHRLFS